MAIAGCVMVITAREGFLTYHESYGAGWTFGSEEPHLIPKISKVFVTLGFANFLIGSSLGLWMSWRTGSWSALGSWHGELNPYGWLTMLIYGMTYAVLSLSAGLKLPWPVFAWIHCLVAEGGAVLIVWGMVTHSAVPFQLGVILQTAAPVVFLVNILSAVFEARRRARHMAEPAQPDRRDTGNAAVVQQLFGPLTGGQAADRVAQRGTDLALMLYVIAAVGMAVANFHTGVAQWVAPAWCQVLAYYGWIAGTVLAVATHLYPRMAGRPLLTRSDVTIGQTLWLGGVLVSALGFISSGILSHLGSRLVGIALVWSAWTFLRTLPDFMVGRKFGSLVPAFRPPAGSRWAWTIAWAFAGMLGLALLIGLPILSLASFHLLFLGWTTTLVYGVGYSFFPLILGRTPRSGVLSRIQVVLSTVGALSLVSAFLLLMYGRVHNLTNGLLAIGGTLAAAGAFLFLFQWSFGERTNFS